MTEEEKAQALRKNVRIDFENSICANKKPYFFTYVYPTLQNEYKNYRSEYNKCSKQNFNKSIKDLMCSKDKNRKEKEMISRYHRYLPVLNNNCSMNALARYVEHAEFENKWAKNEEKFDHSILKSNMPDKLSNEEKRKIRTLLGFYNQTIKSKWIMRGKNN